MNYLPLFHRIQGHTCLVVGGGQVALRKLRILSEAGAHIVLVAPEVDEAVAHLLETYQQAGGREIAVIQRRAFNEADLDGVNIVERSALQVIALLVGTVELWSCAA